MTDISTPVQRPTHLLMKWVLNIVLEKDMGETHRNRELFNIETDDKSLRTHTKNKCFNPPSINELKNCSRGFFPFKVWKRSTGVKNEEFTI